MNNKSLWMSIGLIAALGFLVYANSLGGAFIWDDAYLVRDNPHIKAWANIPKVFTEDIGAGVGHSFNFYRPLQMVSYLFDYSLWQLDVRGYHLTNIVFHILAAVTVFGLVAALYGNIRLALLTGILFVIHPIHTEAVSYISSRADPMFLFFLLLSAILYIKNLDSRRMGLYLGMNAGYLCALLSKEMGLILPVLLLLYHYTFHKKIAYREFLTLAVLACAYAVLRMTVFNFATAALLPSSTFMGRVPGFFAAITEYLRLMVLPFHLHMEYGNGSFPWTHPEAVAGVIIFMALLYLMFMKRKEKGAVFFGLAWFFLALLPVSNLYPINATMAEHWMYLPSVGLFLIAAKGLNAIYEKEGLRNWFMPIVLVLAVFYSSLTIAQNGYWRDEIAFYEKSLRYAPRSMRMHNGLALAYYEAGEKDKAISAYKKAIEALPQNASMHNNLGALYLATGQGQQAEGMFLRAIELDEGYGEPYGNLAILYSRRSQYKPAAEYCDKANRLGVANLMMCEDLKKKGDGQNTR